VKEDFSMVLLFGVPAALVLGLLGGSRLLRLLILALFWFVRLAAQTAYLAHPGRKGFFGVDGMAAVQFDGSSDWAALAYWPSQVLLAALLLGVFHLGERLRGRKRVATPQEMNLR